MPIVSTASYFLYPHIHYFLLHPVIHLMTLHILHNTHVYHHPPIPNLFTFFLTTFSLFTPRHVLHFFLPLHGHAWPHHTHISYPPCISSPSNTQLTHFLSHHIFSLYTTPHTHFFFKCPSNSFPSPLHGHVNLHTCSYTSLHPMHMATLMPIMPIFTLTSHTSHTYTHLTTSPNPFLFLNLHIPITTFSLFTTLHVLHFFPPLHGHAWPHHTHISYPPCISSPSNTQLTHFLSHHIFSLHSTPYTHFFFKCPSNSFPSPLHDHVNLHTRSYSSPHPMHMATLMPIMPIFTLTSHTPHTYTHLTTSPNPFLSLNLHIHITTFSLSTPHHIPTSFHLCMTMLTSIPVATLHPIPCTWPPSCPSCSSSHSHLIPPIYIYPFNHIPKPVFLSKLSHTHHHISSLYTTPCTHFFSPLHGHSWPHYAHSVPTPVSCPHLPITFIPISHILMHIFSPTEHLKLTSSHQYSTFHSPLRNISLII